MKKSVEKEVIETIEILQQLKENRIDITSAQKKIFLKDGTSREKLLCEIKDKRINNVIKELGLSPYLEIGKRITKAKTYTRDKTKSAQNREKVKNKLKEFGIIKSESIDVSKTLQLLRELENAGINITRIKTTKKGSDERIRLKDLQLENVDEILNKLEINEDFPLGKGILKIVSIYTDKSYLKRKNLSEQDKKEIEQFVAKKHTFGKSTRKKTIKETVDLIERIVEYGVDFSFVYFKPCKKGVQEPLKLGELPLTEDQFTAIKKEFGLDKEFNIGSRILHIRQIEQSEYNEVITEEQRKKLKEFNIINKRPKGKIPKQTPQQDTNSKTSSELYKQLKKQKQLIKKLEEANLLEQKVRNELKAKNTKYNKENELLKG